jgi:cardiolipin synthase
MIRGHEKIDRGFEVGALLPAAASKVVQSTLKEWASSFPWLWRSGATRGEHLGDFCPADARLRDGVVRVTDLHGQPLPRVDARDALRLEDAAQPELKPSPPPGELPREVRFTWQVHAPVIPREARERLRTVERETVEKGGKRRKVPEKVSFDPPAFEHRGTTYVKMRSLDEADAARRLADELGGVVGL